MKEKQKPQNDCKESLPKPNKVKCMTLLLQLAEDEKENAPQESMRKLTPYKCGTILLQLADDEKMHHKILERKRLKESSEPE